MTIKLKEEDEIRVRIFKALADPTRIEIIRMLYQTKQEKSFGAVGEKCETPKANISYHFRTLREAGLVKIRQEAQTKFVTLNMEVFERYMPGFLNTL
ncbi:metalloregulator ArsR/SmtB family transcription factor [Paenibacillus filicis]|uniref:Metalloregulator ArsR/SmtB family transcription factor n=1 Tax=Paenibacillus gyeongsangnamensis TaxID=3388067 RepID=A0ABT4QIH7_9BACL|nr:metalloregulator ArsR/SmtB family transcription factor [Paenibacillus filicis]MCZ8516650.1 metalloregulator ArsR/SmtB family transcription factor [Paenibacillus filicis]